MTTQATPQTTTEPLETVADPTVTGDAPNLMEQAERDLEVALAAADAPTQTPPAETPAAIPEATTPPAGETPAETPSEASTETPPAAPPADTSQSDAIAADYLRMQQENQQYRQQAQQAQDSQYAQQMATRYMADLVGKGWEEENARAAAQTLQSTAQQAAEAYRSRQAFSDAAFLAGQQHNLDITQVQELANAPDGNQFTASLQRFTNAAPTAREQQLQEAMNGQTQELAAVKAEMEELRKQVVPNGQRFGDIQGTGVQQSQTDVASQASDILDNFGDKSDDFWDNLDKQFGFGG